MVWERERERGRGSAGGTESLLTEHIILDLGQKHMHFFIVTYAQSDIDARVHESVDVLGQEGSYTKSTDTHTYTHTRTHPLHDQPPVESRWDRLPSCKAGCMKTEQTR